MNQIKKPLLHRYQTRLKLYDTDASGRLYFASLFRLAQDATEEMMAGAEFPIADFLNRDSDCPCSLVVVHAEADYKAALRVSDCIDIHTQVSQLGQTSFSLSHHFYHARILAATASTTHVCLDKDTQRPMPIPQRLRRMCDAYTSM